MDTKAPTNDYVALNWNLAIAHFPKQGQEAMSLRGMQRVKRLLLHHLNHVFKHHIKDAC